MNTYEFELILDRDPTEDELDALEEGGCDDGTVAFGGSEPPSIGFDRESATLVDAVISAIEQVEESTELRVVAIDADPLVTIQDIAECTGRTRESIRLLINGRRGPGGFPSPTPGSAERRRTWRWSDVAAWLPEDLPLAAEGAVITRAVNGWLQLRGSVPTVAPPLAAVRDAIMEQPDVA